ncbi:MAG: SelT/SelW/SelH family protein [Chloroflexi bacterium]|nr:SelT/SelW/SelH family protein [Chloroflexota bacterium]
MQENAEQGKPQVEIRYCTGCGYFPQAAWIATEFWSEFSGAVGLALTPVEGGRLEVLLDGVMLFDRLAQNGAFPNWNDVRVMRRAVRKKLPAPKAPQPVG